METEIKALIFDMDGVLIEAKDLHYQSLNRALGLFGYTISRYDHLITYDGLPTATKLDMLSREQGLPIKLHTFINKLKQKYTLELVHTHCKPCFYHEYALSKLKSDGYKIGCASNSIKDSVNVMLEKSNLKQYMDVIYSAQDVLNAKPAPDIYLNAMRELGCIPEQCLIVEDNENGIKAAYASGAHVLVVNEVNEVNIDNINRAISKAEGKGK